MPFIMIQICMRTLKNSIRRDLILNKLNWDHHAPSFLLVSWTFNLVYVHNQIFISFTKCKLMLRMFQVMAPEIVLACDLVYFKRKLDWFNCYNILNSPFAPEPSSHLSILQRNLFFHQRMVYGLKYPIWRCDRGKNLNETIKIYANISELLFVPLLLEFIIQGL